MIEQQQIDEARQRIEKASNILVTSHVRPDGDAIGSVIAMGLALQDKGKRVHMVLDDGAPSRFRFLQGYDQIVKQVNEEVDLVIALDCGEARRIGGVNNLINHIDINIDHHASNPHFGEINLVDEKSPAVTEMLGRLLPAFGLEITLPVAQALLTGIITDTLGFKTSNMQPNTLRLAADLFEMGADLPALYDQALSRKSYKAVSYWGAGLSQLMREGRIIWATLSLADRKSVGYRGRDDADLISLLASVSDNDVAIIFVQQDEQVVKVSWRASNGFNVAQIAQHFGGGGHAAAAGATISGDLDEVRQAVLKATKEFLAA